MKMKKKILAFALSFVTYFGFGQCGPYHLTYSCTTSTLSIPGAASAQKIVWQINGTTINTIYSQLIGPVTTVAGGNGQGATDTQLSNPRGVYVDGSGNIYVADGDNNRIQKFPAGSTSATHGVTVAGGNGFGYGANQFNWSVGVWVDGAGYIYVADYYNNRIQKFAPGSTSADTGITIASNLDGADGLYLDSAGNIYVADQLNSRIQKFPANSTSANPGTTVASEFGSGGTTNLGYPTTVYLDRSGNIYVADPYYERIQKFPAGSTQDTNGITVAGGNGPGSAANQLSPLTGADGTLAYGLYVDNSGNLYVGDYGNNRVLKFPPGSTSATNGITVAGGSGTSSFAANGLSSPTGLYIDSAGNIYISDEYNSRIQKWSQPAISVIDTAMVPTVAGSYVAIITDSSGCVMATDTLYINPVHSSYSSQTICGGTYAFGSRILSSSGTYYDTLTSVNGCDSIVTLYFTVNPTGGPYMLSDRDSSCTSILSIAGASYTQRIIWQKGGIAIDTVYAPGGLTIAGGNDTGSAANQFSYPQGMYVDGSGNIYVADFGNNRIQKFPAGSTSATNGTTVAGGNGAGSGANQLNQPSGVYVDGSGNIYVADFGNNRIQKFPAGSTSATNATTVAGGNGAGSAANQLYYPAALFKDGSGNIYVADQNNNRIQKFPAGSTSADTGITVAGGNGYGGWADQLESPTSVYVDGSGNIFVPDGWNNRIQKFPAGSTSATNGITLAGGNGYGNAANQFEIPSGVYVDGLGNIYVADYGNARIQKWKQIGIDTTLNVTTVGSYSAIITNSYDCIAITDTVNVQVSRPTAFFTLQPSSTPHLWYAVNQCTGNRLTYVWSWGDSTTSTGDTPSHTYDSAGYYHVCVTATDSAGCTDSYCDTSVYLFKDQSGQMVYVNVVTQLPTGINTISAESLNISYYAGAVHLSEALIAPTQLRLYDMSGRMVMEQDDFGGSVWNIPPDIAQGVYAIQLQNQSYSIARKLMILQ